MLLELFFIGIIPSSNNYIHLIQQKTKLGICKSKNVKAKTLNKGVHTHAYAHTHQKLKQGRSMIYYVDDDTASFFKCSINVCKLTSSVRIGAPWPYNKIIKIIYSTFNKNKSLTCPQPQLVWVWDGFTLYKRNRA